MRYLFIILYCLFGSTSFPQDKIQKLIVAEYRLDSPQIARYVYVTSYNFKKGIFVSKDTLLGIDSKDRYIGFNHPKGHMYQNRFHIRPTGGVIDLKDRKFLTDRHSDDYVESLGDTLVFYRDNTKTGKGYLALDLRTHTYDFIEENSWYTPKLRRQSPDRKHYLSIDWSQLPRKIWLYDESGNKTVIVEDAGMGPQKISDAQMPDVETHWLNNHSFLYVVHHNKRDEQNRIYHKVDLRKYDLLDNSDKIYFSLDSIRQGLLNGRFTKDSIQQTIYIATTGSHYLLDTINHKLIGYPVYQAGEGFSYCRIPKEGLTIQFHNKPIGTLWCNTPTVTHYAIATEYGDTGSNLGYPKGIKIWTAQQNDWITFDLPWVNAIIGWIEEE